MAATYDANLKILEQKLKVAGLYHTSLRPAMKECALIMTRIHHYNREVEAHKYRTAMPDGKRPPELMALEGDVGGNVVIRAHPDALLLYETSAAELRDVDTVEALAAVQEDRQI